MRRVSLIALLGPLLACTGLLAPADIVALTPTEGDCGHWSADVAVAHARGETLELRRDGEVVGTWPDLWGSPTIHAEGTGTPGQLSELRASIVRSPEVEVVPLLLGRPALTIHAVRPAFASGASPRFDINVDPDCPAAGIRYRAATELWDGAGDARPGTTTITLPPHPDGVHVLRVELASEQGALGTATERFAVGATAEELDLDGDGYAGVADCDDRDPTVNPFAAERPDPNDRDDDCDGLVDEGTIAYDDDGDGLSERAGDCDDRDAWVRPGADERADCRDNDCDGQVDEGRSLARVDDTYEQPGGAAYQFPDARRRFEAAVVLVSRGVDDVESVRFVSDDGDWDDWGIDVIGRRVPVDSTYEVELKRVGGERVGAGTIRGDGERIEVRGAPFRDDSGVYELVVRPTHLYAPYCPVELAIVSR